MNISPPGTRIGQYEIASRPMMGGMGVVYFALDHGNDGRPVALKTFRPELLPDRAARDRFLREGTAWIELGSHPHIVRCYKVEYIDPTAFLVLELIAKEQNMPDASLRSWLIPGCPLPVEQALLFALQIARGMQHATEKIPGFIHRDLKPENILVGADNLPATNINRLRVTDFGLAKTIAESGGSSPLSNPEELKPNQIQFTRGAGTPLYMAPEQWNGEPIGVFTDVYAFGCILYEMLTGKHAAEGRTISELQASHCGGRLKPMPSDLPKDVVMLAGRCLTLKQNQRLQAWNEITDGLEHIYKTNFGKSTPAGTAFGDQSHEERMQVGWSCNAMGVAYQDLGKADVAIEYFEKALLIANEIGSQTDESIFLNNLGPAYTRLGSVQKAIECIEHALTIIRETGNQHHESVALSNLGNAYLTLGDAKRAISYYEMALQIAREIGYRQGESSVLGNLGIAFKNLGNAQQAIIFFEQYLAISREMSDLRGEENALSGLGNAYEDLGDANMAIKCYKQALAIDRHIGDRRGEGIDLGNLGNIYADLGELDLAISYYEGYLAIARETGDRQNEGNALNNLGEVNRNRGNNQLAIEYYEKALTIAREIADKRGERNAICNLGNAYTASGDMQLALNHYEHSLAIDHEIGDLNGIATDSFNMAALFSQTGKNVRALQLAKEAESIWTKTGSPYIERARDLIIQIQGGTSLTSVPINPMASAFQIFHQAASPHDMQLAVAKYSFMLDKQFIQAIEEIISEQVPSELKPTFTQRLDWLKQLANK